MPYFLLRFKENLPYFSYSIKIIFLSQIDILLHIKIHYFQVIFMIHAKKLLIHYMNVFLIIL